MVLLQARRRRREAIAHAAQDCSNQFQLYLPGSQLFQQTEATSSALQRHLVRSLAIPLLDWLLRYQVCSPPTCCDRQKTPAVFCHPVRPLAIPLLDWLLRYYVCPGTDT